MQSINFLQKKITTKNDLNLNMLPIWMTFSGAKYSEMLRKTNKQTCKPLWGWKQMGKAPHEEGQRRSASVAMETFHIQCVT